jgi:hypothetical protein
MPEKPVERKWGITPLRNPALSLVRTPALPGTHPLRHPRALTIVGM